MARAEARGYIPNRKGEFEIMNWLRKWFDFSPGFKVFLVLLFLLTVALWFTL